MHEYSHYPPHKQFSRVLKNCPKSALIYVELWNARGKKTSTYIDKNKIRKNFLISPTIFRNLATSLAALNLISFDEDEEGFSIYLNGRETDV